MSKTDRYINLEAVFASEISISSGCEWLLIPILKETWYYEHIKLWGGSYLHFMDKYFIEQKRHIEILIRSLFWHTNVNAKCLFYFNEKAHVLTRPDHRDNSSNSCERQGRFPAKKEREAYFYLFSPTSLHAHTPKSCVIVLKLHLF